MFASSRLAAVADGVGGAVAGEIASRLAIDALIGLDKSRLSDTLESELSHAVRHGNDTIAFLASCRPEHAGMATTLSTVALDESGRYLIASIGDSRVYLLRNGSLSQLTRDDSFVQDLLDRGAITPEEALRHPQRSIVTDALDGRTRSEVSIEGVPAQVGDRLLLCSDGLTDVVDERQIATLLRTRVPQSCAQALVQCAIDVGARDNVSVIVADVQVRIDPDSGWLPVLARK